MIDRLRFLLDRPLDPLGARAIVAAATAILLGLAALFVLGAGESGRQPAASRQAVSAQAQPDGSFGDARAEATPPAPRASRRRRQDPQDEKGSVAAARAAKAMRSHRALQYVPYRHGRLSVRLIGARGERAELAVRAPTISVARRGWRAFLRRYRDGGHAYLTRFEATGGRSG